MENKVCFHVYCIAYITLVKAQGKAVKILLKTILLRKAMVKKL